MKNTYLQNYNKAMEGIANEITKEAITQAVNKATELIAEYKTDLIKVKKDYEILSKTQEETNNKLKETNNKLDDSIKKYEKLEDATYVLATDDGKMKELTGMMQSLTYKKFTGTKNSLKDKLFHRSITNTCYKHLYGQYQINSYKRIKIDEYDESVKVIKRWFDNEQNIKKSVNKKLQEYINDKNLPNDKQKIVDKYLELTNGGNNIAIQ